MQEKNMGHICPIGRSGVKRKFKETALQNTPNRTSDKKSEKQDIGREQMGPAA